MVDQEISQHRVAEGSADERCHHRVSQGRAPLSQTESAKESGHYHARRCATGKNGRHALVGLLRQSVFGRLAGYEDVNDAERLRHDPAIRWIVGGTAAHSNAASPSQMGRFETQWLAAPATLSALADSSVQWI